MVTGVSNHTASKTSEAVYEPFYDLEGLEKSDVTPRHIGWMRILIKKVQWAGIYAVPAPGYLWKFRRI